MSLPTPGQVAKKDVDIQAAKSFNKIPPKMMGCVVQDSQKQNSTGAKPPRYVPPHLRIPSAFGEQPLMSKTFVANQKFGVGDGNFRMLKPQEKASTVNSLLKDTGVEDKQKKKKAWLAKPAENTSAAENKLLPANQRNSPASEKKSSCKPVVQEPKVATQEKLQGSEVKIADQGADKLKKCNPPEEQRVASRKKNSRALRLQQNFFPEPSLPEGEQLPPRTRHVVKISNRKVSGDEIVKAAAVAA